MTRLMASLVKVNAGCRHGVEHVHDVKILFLTTAEDRACSEYRRSDYIKPTKIALLFYRTKTLTE